jgi:hypothetical protein
LQQPTFYIHTSEDNTIRYWRVQKARGKLQIAEETEQWVNKYKKYAAAINPWWWDTVWNNISIVDDITAFIAWFDMRKCVYRPVA